jgi:uncharacterized protein (TIGR02452 family)
MDRKAVANETVRIMRQGYYEVPQEGSAQEGQKPQIKRMDIKADMEQSIRESFLITPRQGEELLRKYENRSRCRMPQTRVENISTVDAVRLLAEEDGGEIGVLNFASAKNPGGGFLNGAMAQEESLAASSTLYRTLIAHEEYYRENRVQRSMMYLDYGIYSPDVVFFRDGEFHLTEHPMKASVLTLPAVNMGQVILKGENQEEARRVMRRRMKLVLAVFAERKVCRLVLGAYGCGVFRNEPREVAAWWRELFEEGMAEYFDAVFYAVLDHSRGQSCITAFREEFGKTS